MTRVFAHKSFVGIQASPTLEGILNHPNRSDQLGFVLDAKFLEISEEAIKLLESIPASNDAIGDIDVFKCVEPERIVFCWLGGPLQILHAPNSEGSRDYKPSLLRAVARIVKNEPPKEFIEACERRQNE